MAPPTVEYTAALSGTGSTVAAADNGAMIAGDTRLVWISVSNTTATAPAGWDLLLAYTLASSRNGYIFRRTHAGGSEPATATWTFGAGNNHSLVQAGIRGADGGALDFVPTSASGTSGTPTAPGETTLRDDSLALVCFHAMVVTAGVSWSTPSGWTARVTTAGNGSNGHASALFSRNYVSPSAIGGPASTPSSGSVWGASLLALPAPPAGPPPIRPVSQPRTARRRAANF